MEHRAGPVLFLLQGTVIIEKYSHNCYKDRGLVGFFSFMQVKCGVVI